VTPFGPSSSSTAKRTATAQVLDQFTQQSGAVFDAATILVGAPVKTPRQKMRRQGQSMSGINIDNVETRFLRAKRRIAVPFSQCLDIRLVHGASMDGVVVVDHYIRRRHRHFAAHPVDRLVTVMGQFDAGQRSVLVHGVGHERQGRDVAIVPQAGLRTGTEIAAVMDIAFLGADHGPAAFRLDAAHTGHRAGHGMAHAVAMRYLVEPVPRGHRPNLYRFEEDIVTRIARHWWPPIFLITAAIMLAVSRMASGKSHKVRHGSCGPGAEGGRVRLSTNCKRREICGFLREWSESAATGRRPGISISVPSNEFGAATTSSC
jgi:hypothetical protein